MSRPPVAQQQVLDYLLRFGPVLTQQPFLAIAAGTGMAVTSVRHAMRQLVAKGSAEVLTDGKRFVAAGLPGSLVGLDLPPAETVEPEALTLEAIMANDVAETPDYQELASALLTEVIRFVRVTPTPDAGEAGRSTQDRIERHLRDRVASLECQLDVEREKARTAGARAEVAEDRLRAAVALYEAPKRNHRPAGAPAHRASQKALTAEERSLLEALQTR